MQIYSQKSEYKLLQGNMLDMGEFIQDKTIDSIVTDPPYELNFMGKGWDNSGIAFQKETWEKCLKALKPGGYLLVFGGSRTYHRIACAIEDAGFEIRDCIMWLYGSGFPKSMNIGKGIESKLLNGTANPKDFKNLEGEKHSVTCGFNATGKKTGYRDKEYEMTKIDVEYKTELGNKYKGWGTALKPSYEPIIVARKPLEGSCTDNVIKYGVGGINIDECRVEYNGTPLPTASGMGTNKENHTSFYLPDHKYVANDIGRFPANTILTYSDDDREEVCSGFPNVKGDKGGIINGTDTYRVGWISDKGKKFQTHRYSDGGSCSRYFYCAKASKRDRDEGLPEGEHSTHPTVKPCDLMQYLVRLVTPNGGTVLDPFNGSGSTGKAVMYENKDRNKNYKYIGIELTEEYLPIAKARIEYAINKEEEKKSDLQQSLF